MQSLFLFLFLLSIVGFVAGIGAIIYSVIKKRPKNKFVRAVVGSVVLFIISTIGISQTTTPEQMKALEQEAAERNARRVADEKAEAKRIEEQRLADETAAQKKAQDEVAAQAKIEEENRQKLEARTAAEKAKIEEAERERQEEIEMQKRVAKIEQDRNAIIRRVNDIFGGNHLVTVTGDNIKGVSFELDVGTNDIESAKNIAVNAIYDVQNALNNYQMGSVQVIAVNRKTPVGIITYDKDEGFSILADGRNEVFTP